MCTPLCCAVLQVMAALEVLQASRRQQQQQQQKDAVLWAVLHLLAGHQVKAAVALAASVGDVRLASLLAAVNTAARGRHAQQLLQQIQLCACVCFFLQVERGGASHVCSPCLVR
jgi:hypothetical protein